MTIMFGFALPHEFATEPSSRPSKKRDKALKLIKERGQERRILVSNYGEVLDDVHYYEALLLANYPAIAVAFVLGPDADIKATKAASAKHPLPWAGGSMMPPGAEYAKCYRDYTEYLNAKQNS